jgi:hypothetical protein
MQIATRPIANGVEWSGLDFCARYLRSEKHPSMMIAGAEQKPTALHRETKHFANAFTPRNDLDIGMVSTTRFSAQADCAILWEIGL